MTTFRDLQTFGEPLAQIDRVTQIKAQGRRAVVQFVLELFQVTQKFPPHFKNDTICALRGHSSLQNISITEAENASAFGQMRTAFTR
jgi:hypothetical protein